MVAQIRFLTVIGNPVAFTYLDAIGNSPRGVSIGPIGPAFISIPPWNQYAHLFGKPVAQLPWTVNVVCAALGMRLGAYEDMYEAETAFKTYWTQDMINVAVVLPGGSSEAFGVLEAYDLVVSSAPVPEVDTKNVYPHDFLEEIENLIAKYERKTPEQER